LEYKKTVLKVNLKKEKGKKRKRLAFNLNNKFATIREVKVIKKEDIGLEPE